MKWLALALFALGCNHAECVLPGAPEIVSGTGALGDDVMNAVEWTEPSAPTLTESVSFAVTFGSGPSLECNRIPWSAVAHGVVVDVSELCVVIDGSNGDEALVVGTTLSLSSTIHAANEGTITLHIDVAAQSTRFGALAVSGLVATVSFARSECPSQGCGRSFDLSNV